MPFCFISEQNVLLKVLGIIKSNQQWKSPMDATYAHTVTSEVRNALDVALLLVSSWIHWMSPPITLGVILLLRPPWVGASTVFHIFSVCEERLLLLFTGIPKLWKNLWKSSPLNRYWWLCFSSFSIRLEWSTMFCVWRSFSLPHVVKPVLFQWFLDTTCQILMCLGKMWIITVNLQFKKGDHSISP